MRKSSVQPKNAAANQRLNEDDQTSSTNNEHVHEDNKETWDKLENEFYYKKEKELYWRTRDKKDYIWLQGKFYVIIYMCFNL